MKRLCLFFILMAHFVVVPVGLAQHPGQIVLGMGSFTIPFLDTEPNPGLIIPFIHRSLASTGMAFANHSGVNFNIHTTVRAGYEKAIDVNGVPLTAAELTISFELSDQQGDRSFAHLDVVIRESGETPIILVRNTLRQLKSHNRSFEKFLADGRSNIQAYYQQHCQSILARARQKVDLGDFQGAMMIVGQVPFEVPCYTEASDLLLEAHSAMLDRECEVLEAEARTLAASRKFDEAYEKALIIPQNSRCAGNVTQILDMIADAVCEAYLIQAEAFFTNNDLDRCVEALASVESMGTNCTQRKNQLEIQIKNNIQAAKRQQWEFKQQQYRDVMSKQKAEMGHAFSIEMRKLDQADRRQTGEIRQQAFDQDYRMKKLDKDAEIRAKELNIAPELEKYRARVAIQQSKDNRMVKIIQSQEASKVYQSYFHLAAQSPGR
jgi:hypothetical protein